jgi:hypothetical protein
MFIAITRPTMGPQNTVAVPGSPAIPALTPRALHARLLDNAAARRRRGLERKQARRTEDAAYWISVAPLAVRKACALRLTDFAVLP